MCLLCCVVVSCQLPILAEHTSLMCQLMRRGEGKGKKRCSLLSSLISLPPIGHHFLFAILAILLFSFFFVSLVDLLCVCVLPLEWDALQSAHAAGSPSSFCLHFVVGVPATRATQRLSLTHSHWRAASTSLFLFFLLLLLLFVSTECNSKEGGQLLSTLLTVPSTFLLQGSIF